MSGSFDAFHVKIAQAYMVAVMDVLVWLEVVVVPVADSGKRRMFSIGERRG